MFDRIKTFIGNWQDGVLWIPIALALMLGATFLLPADAGVDNLGFLQGYAILLAKGCVITFAAWLCKRTYTHDWDKGDELRLMRTAQQGHWQAVAIDRLEWLMWLGFWYFVLSN